MLFPLWNFTREQEFKRKWALSPLKALKPAWLVWVKGHVSPGAFPLPSRVNQFIPNAVGLDPPGCGHLSPCISLGQPTPHVNHQGPQQSRAAPTTCPYLILLLRSPQHQQRPEAKQVSPQSSLPEGLGKVSILLAPCLLWEVSFSKPYWSTQGM